MSVFTVDFGHTLSGGDTGARGNNFIEEKLTREIGNLVVQGLRKEGHTVYPIQLDYANSMLESLNYRVNKIISINPTQSISIHINAATNIEATGVEVWGDNLCKDMCIRISDNISKEFNLANRGFKNGCESLALVGLYGLSNVPALLVECFFISNGKDCSKYNAQKYADCIVSGILNKRINNVIEERKYDMKNLVCYCNQVDKRAAEYLADHLQCPCIDATLPFNYSNVAENIIAVGGDNPRKGENGQVGFTGYTTKYIAGKDRYETAKEVLKFIGKL